jgi:hypothetical protein
VHSVVSSRTIPKNLRYGAAAEKKKKICLTFCFVLAGDAKRRSNSQTVQHGNSGKTKKKKEDEEEEDRTKTFLLFFIDEKTRSLGRS